EIQDSPVEETYIDGSSTEDIEIQDSPVEDISIQEPPEIDANTEIEIDTRDLQAPTSPTAISVSNASQTLTTSAFEVPEIPTAHSGVSIPTPNTSLPMFAKPAVFAAPSSAFGQPNSGNGTNPTPPTGQTPPSVFAQPSLPAFGQNAGQPAA